MICKIWANDSYRGLSVRGSMENEAQTMQIGQLNSKPEF